MGATVGATVGAIVDVTAVSAHEHLHARVHERVRSRLQASGIDATRDPQALRAVVEAEVSAVVAQELADAAIDLPDRASLVREALHAVAGLGPLQPLLDDPEVEEIWINAPDRVFVARHGRSELTSIVLTATGVRDLVERMLRSSGRRVDRAHPFVDASLADGSRLHVVIPDVTREHWSVNIRRFVARPASVHDLVRSGVLTSAAATFLDDAVRAGRSIIVCGGTQAGKTTMLNALLGAVEHHERVVSCEEVFELRVPIPDWVALQTRDAGLEGDGEISLRRLVREALRMRPTRLVIGEVRHAECLDLLLAMNCGMPAMSTLHANSPREAVLKLCTLPLLAGENVAPAFVTPTVASCVDLLVQMDLDAQGSRRVRCIAELSGRVESGVIEIGDVFVDHGHGLERRLERGPERGLAREGAVSTSGWAA